MFKDVTNSLLGKSGISKPNWTGNKVVLESLKKDGDAIWAENVVSSPKESEESVARQLDSIHNGPQQPMAHNPIQLKDGAIGAVPPRPPDPNSIEANLGHASRGYRGMPRRGM